MRLRMILAAPAVVLGAGVTVAAFTPPPPASACGTASGSTSTSGGWVRVGATLDPTYTGGAFQQFYHSGFSYAELGATPGYPNYVGGLISRALGLPAGQEGLPGGFALLIRPVGSNSPGVRILKSDIGSGQAGDLHYAIDLHPAIAAAIGFNGKQDVEIRAAGSSPGGSLSTGACASTASLTFTNGPHATIRPDGTASAPVGAPTAVQAAIGAANQISTKPYPSPDVHYGPLSTMWPAYDCSGATSYVLYRAGLMSSAAKVSGDFMTWGLPGPGQWITVYSSPTHAFIDIAGRAFDTAHYGLTTPPGTGPRWLLNPIGNLRDGLAYTVTHPPGL